MSKLSKNLISVSYLFIDGLLGCWLAVIKRVFMVVRYSLSPFMLHNLDGYHYSYFDFILKRLRVIIKIYHTSPLAESHIKYMFFFDKSYS